TGLARHCLPERPHACLPSLRRGGGDWETMLTSLARLYVAGAAVDWSGFDRDYPRRKVSLPTYPFQRQRFWVDVAPVHGPHVVVDLYGSFVRSGFGSSFLTFGLFDRPLPGFSWLQAMVFPREHEEEAARLLQAQRELRELLFEEVDFAACTRVLDFGC